MNFDKDYYGILRILPSAEDFLIKSAYRALAQKYHPDKFNGPKEKTVHEEKMKEINGAYAILSDAIKRKQYDDYLKQNNRQNEYHEEDPVGSDSSDPINESDWRMAVEYVPDLKSLYNSLKVISPNLAFNFKLYILKDKAFDKANEVAKELEIDFFNTFFSKNKDIISFAKYLLNNNRRKEVQELNMAVKLFGNKIEADKIINNICLKYTIKYCIKTKGAPKEPDLRTAKERWIDKGMMQCPSCLAIVKPRMESTSSFWVGFFLCLLFIVPGLLYWIFTANNMGNICPICSNVIPKK